jgi:MFS superfamily sulfate permease-like transporter
MDFIAFVFLVAVIVALIVSVINLTIKNRRMAVELLQSTIDHNIALTMLAEELKKNENVSVEKTDGFLKFISESRDLAFEYIEKVQDSLVKFKSEVDPEIDYMLTYGTVTGDNLSLKAFKKIEKAYRKLMNEALPQENKKN